ncbi:MAG: hypothetical protein J6R35_01475, partial [Clostridia bacterium]|nr:hypothetical protein [Clostridia bacterium]
AKNATRNRKIEYMLSGNEIKYTLDGNVILDTTGKVYAATSTMNTELTNTKYSQTEITGDYENLFATNCATAPGNAIGFGGFSFTANIFDFQVKLNGITEDTMPNLKDPSFYIVNSASPAIPMFVGKQVVVSDLAVEIGGELVLGSDITWDVADGTNVKVLGDYIYAAKTGKTKLTATYGGKTQNVWAIVNEENDYDFYLAYEDWKRDYTSFDANKWMFVTGNEPYKNEFYHTALSENAGATWGYYYPYSSSSSHFEFYYAAKMGMIFYQSEILKDFSDYTFSATLLNPTDYSCGTARGFVLRADVNFDAPIDDTTKVFNTSGLYLGQHRHGAVYVGSIGQPLLKGASDSTGAYHGMPRWTFHSLPGDGYLKFVNTKETVADSAAAAITAGEWAGDPNYVMSMHSAGYQNAKVVTIKLEGTDILYKIGENTVLDTKAEKVYALNDYYKYSTAVNEEYDWAANTDKIATNSGTIGFHAKQGMSHIYGFNVKLNDVSAETMPKMSN